MFAIYDLLTFIRWTYYVNTSEKITESISFIDESTAEHFMVQMTWSLSIISSIEQFSSLSLSFSLVIPWRSFDAMFNRHYGAFMLLMPMEICTNVYLLSMENEHRG